MESSKIGADPEFSLWDSHLEVFVKANKFFPGGIEGSIGNDGNPETGELRPAPGTPSQVAARLGVLIRHVIRLTERSKIQLVAGPWGGNPLGGHLHFNTLHAPPPHPVTHLIKCLDFYAALPFALLENPEHAKARLEAGYGAIGAYRSQPWGIEYRTLSSWLDSRVLTKTILRLAFNIVFTKLELQPKRFSWKAFNERDRVKLLSYMPAVLKGWARLSLVDSKLRPLLAWWKHCIQQGYVMQEMDFGKRWRYEQDHCFSGGENVSDSGNSESERAA